MPLKPGPAQAGCATTRAATRPNPGAAAIRGPIPNFRQSGTPPQGRGTRALRTPERSLARGGNSNLPSDPQSGDNPPGRSTARRVTGQSAPPDRGLRSFLFGFEKQLWRRLGCASGFGQEVANVSSGEGYLGNAKQNGAELSSRFREHCSVGISLLRRRAFADLHDDFDKSLQSVLELLKIEGPGWQARIHRQTLQPFRKSAQLRGSFACQQHTPIETWVPQLCICQALDLVHAYR